MISKVNLDTLCRRNIENEHLGTATFLLWGEAAAEAGSERFLHGGRGGVESLNEG